MKMTEQFEPRSRRGDGASFDHTNVASSEARAARVVEEYLAELEAGRRPDQRALIERHPDIASLLEKCFESLEFVQSAGAQLEPITGEIASGGGCELTSEGRTLGDFRIVREIGRGGMGIVYEAEQISLNRRVALKVLPFAAVMDSKQLQRFKNEAQAAAQMHHTNIVPVYFVGSDRGMHYYAMQLIDGQTLSQVIGDLRRTVGMEEIIGNRLSVIGEKVEDVTSLLSDRIPNTHYRSPPSTVPVAALSTERSTKPREFYRTVAQLGIQAAEALDHAHELGILHRDIKPSNLLIDVRGKLWITDFGLARVQADTNLTMTGDLVGTLRYMSPEQALAKRVVVDHRTDIYSLGVTLCELLTLRPVFSGEDRQELLRQIAFDEPQAPRKTIPTIPVELETIVLKACAKNPPDRYTTAQELADDLRRYLDDKPIQARRPTLLQQAKRWSRRHRAAVTAAAVITVTTVMLGGLGWTWLALERSARRGDMRRAALEAFQEAAELGGQAIATPDDPTGFVAALSAAKRAGALMPADEHDTALGQQTHDLRAGLERSEAEARARQAQRERDRNFVNDLEEVRSLRTAVHENEMSWSDVDAEYAKVFRPMGWT